MQDYTHSLNKLCKNALRMLKNRLYQPTKVILTKKQPLGFHCPFSNNVLLNTIKWND